MNLNEIANDLSRNGGGKTSSELRPGFQGKIRILHIYASLMLFPQAIRTKLCVQVDDGHRYVTGL